VVEGFDCVGTLPTVHYHVARSNKGEGMLDPPTSEQALGRHAVTPQLISH